MMTTMKMLISPKRTIWKVLLMALGMRATIPANMIKEMPFPTPRSVICSPIHIINAVPELRVIMVMILKPHPGSGTTKAPPGLVMDSNPMAIPRPWTKDRSHCAVAGVLADLLAAGLAFLFQSGQMRYHHGEKFQDDAGRDIGHDAQGEDAHAL